MNQASANAGARRLQQYQALLEVSEAIVRHGDLNALFHDLGQRLRRVVSFDFLMLLLHDPAGNVMRLHILESDQPEQVNLGAGATPLESPSGVV